MHPNENKAQGICAVEASPPQTMQQYYAAMQSNLLKEFAAVELAKTKCSKLGLMDELRDTVYSILHPDYPF